MIPTACASVGLLLFLFSDRTPWRVLHAAVADAYEAMLADRVYSVGIEEQAARSELLRCAGKQFDSRVVAAFLSVLSVVDAAGSVHDVEVA